MGFKRVGDALKEIDLKKIAHNYQKLKYANAANYLSDYFLKTRNNHTPDMLKLSHSDRNRGEGGGYDSK